MYISAIAHAPYLLTAENFRVTLNILNTDANPKNTKHIIKLKSRKNESEKKLIRFCSANSAYPHEEYKKIDVGIKRNSIKSVYFINCFIYLFLHVCCKQVAYNRQIYVKEISTFLNLKRVELAAVWLAAFFHLLCAHF